MQSKAITPNECFDGLPADRRAAMVALRKVIANNLPKGFAEVMQYGMPGWVVPHSMYPAGYHCDPKQPLPFLGIASQKQYIAVTIWASTPIRRSWSGSGSSTPSSPMVD
jgi:uncharacterized protein DUF1801